MLAIFAKLLEGLHVLALMKAGGTETDLSKLLHLGGLAAAAGEEGRAELEAAVAKVKQLVDEDRGLTAEELAALDASIQSKIDRIANVDLDNPGSAG
jgi:hypothetical protein